MIMQDSRNIAEDNTEFIDAIKKGNIPPEPPDIYDYYNFNSEDSMEMFRLKSLCNNHGMWAIVEQKWTKKLANWIGNRKCLEVMAGVGWLAKALSEHGVNIVATDDFSWTLKARHKNESLKEIYPDIIKEDAISAVKKYDADVLIVSWPPYEDRTICDVCDIWGTKKPIVYIGEGLGGCCAVSEFFENYKEDESVSISLPQWLYIHDYITIGNWTRE